MPQTILIGLGFQLATTLTDQNYDLKRIVSWRGLTLLGLGYHGDHVLQQAKVQRRHNGHKENQIGEKSILHWHTTALKIGIKYYFNIIQSLIISFNI